MKTAIFTTAEFSWSQAKHSENTWPLQSTAQFMVHSWLSVFFFSVFFFFSELRQSDGITSDWLLSDLLSQKF